MEREDLENRIQLMLDEADTATLRLIYRFVCGVVYKGVKNTPSKSI